MKILIAPDKFKGSLTATEVCQITKEALLQTHSGWQVEMVPMADGGEGTLDTLISFSRGHKIEVTVRDPLSRNIKASYGLSQDGTTAFVEMAAASGLQLLQPHEQDCRYTTTYGTGQLMKEALNKGASHIILGVGGSATNDAGTGMAEALGFRFEDESGFALKGVGDNLIKMRRINSDEVDPRLSKIKFTVLCDVTNPLHGQQGAAHVFAGQKGAKEKDIELLEAGLKNFERVAQEFNDRIINFPGAGAAGGLGAGAKLFLDANFEIGIDFIIRFTGLKEKVQQADLVISGEGKIDEQTLSGKVVRGIAKLVKENKKRLILVCGMAALNEYQISKLGAEAIITLSDKSVSPQTAMKNARQLLREKIKAFAVQQYN